MIFIVKCILLIKHSFLLTYRNALSQTVKQILHHSIFITIIELENAFKANVY